MTNSEIIKKCYVFQVIGELFLSTIVEVRQSRKISISWTEFHFQSHILVPLSSLDIDTSGMLYTVAYGNGQVLKINPR